MPLPPELPALPELPAPPEVVPLEPFLDFDFDPWPVDFVVEECEPAPAALPELLAPEPEPAPIEPEPEPEPDMVLPAEPPLPVVPAPPPAPDPADPPDCARAAVEPSRTIEIAKAFSMSRLLFTAR
jgi:hypothetical protein